MWTYNQTPSSDELYHYGVLGMKWGKRKSRSKYDSEISKYSKTEKKLTKKQVLSGKAKAKIILGSGLGLASAIYSGKAAGNTNGKKFVIGLLASYGSGRIIRSGLEEQRRNTSKK